MQQRVITIVLLIGLFFGLLSLGSAMMTWRLPDREQGYAPKQPIDYSHRLHAGELAIDCRFCHWAAYRGRYAGIPSTDICMKCHDIVTMTWGRFQALQEAADKAKEAADAATEKTENKEGKASATNESQPPEGKAAAGSKNSSGDGAPATTDEKPKTEKSDSDQATSKTQSADVAVPQLDPKDNKLLPLYESLGLDANAKPVKDAKPHPIKWVRVHNLPDFVYFNHSAHMAVGLTCQKCHGPVETMERVHQFSSLSMGWCVQCHRDSTNNGVNGRTVNAPTNCSACHY